MLKFIFGKAAGKAAIETQRQIVERAVAELNGVLEGMAEKAVVGVDLNSGLLKIDLPEQMPDEALALPAPEKDEAVAEEVASDETTKDEKAAA